jgi:hypothetical protein
LDCFEEDLMHRGVFQLDALEVDGRGELTDDRAKLLLGLQLYAQDVGVFALFMLQYIQMR